MSEFVLFEKSSNDGSHWFRIVPAAPGVNPAAEQAAEEALRVFTHVKAVADAFGTRTMTPDEVVAAVEAERRDGSCIVFLLYKEKNDRCDFSVAGAYPRAGSAMECVGFASLSRLAWEEMGETKPYRFDTVLEHIRSAYEEFVRGRLNGTLCEVMYCDGDGLVRTRGIFANLDSARGAASEYFPDLADCPAG